MPKNNVTTDIDKSGVSVFQPNGSVNRETSIRRLADRLREVAGAEVEAAAPLARMTTLRIGGPADLFVRVDTEDSLVAVMEAVDASGTPLHVHGHGSNVMFPDGGIRGVVCRLRGELKDVDIEDRSVRAGAGATLARLARDTARQGLLGLEALAGFPSTVGGAVVMNAGCYGVEMRDVLTRVRVVRPGLGLATLAVDQLDCAYRTTNLQGTGAVVTSAEFELRHGDGATALARIDELNRRRWQSLPSGKPNAGSVFRNPDGDYAGRLIEACGLKGLRSGGAEISERHANVIVNRGDARAAHVLDLMVTAHRAVRERFGVELSPEVVLAGDLSEEFWTRAKRPAAG